jgi:prolyl-tRNA synthetase
MEKAEALAPFGPTWRPDTGDGQDATPGKSTCADVAELLGVPLRRTVKSLVLATDETNEAGEIVKTQVWLLLLRGDHDMNEIKVAKVPGWRASALQPWRD